MLTLLCGLLAVFGFWSFAATLAPIPKPLLTDSGVIASAEAHRSKGRIAVIWIRVNPSGRDYGYPDILHNAEAVWEKTHSGLPIEIQYSDVEDPEIWSLKIAGQAMITPEAAYQARRENGLWALGVGVAFLGCMLYMLFFHRRRHRFR